MEAIFGRPYAALPCFTNHLHIADGKLFQETVQAFLLRFNKEAVTPESLYPEAAANSGDLAPHELNLTIVGSTVEQASSFIRDRLRTDKIPQNIRPVGVEDCFAIGVRGHSLYGYVVILPEVTMLAQAYLQNLLGVLRDIANAGVKAQRDHNYHALTICDRRTASVLMETQLQWYIQNICSRAGTNQMGGIRSGDYDASEAMAVASTYGILRLSHRPDTFCLERAKEENASNLGVFISENNAEPFTSLAILTAAEKFAVAGYNVTIAPKVLSDIFYDVVRNDMRSYSSLHGICAEEAPEIEDPVRVKFDDLTEHWK